MCTPAGVLFSREAILENLLAQKKANKRKLAAWEAQQEALAREVRVFLAAFPSTKAALAAHVRRSHTCEAGKLASDAAAGAEPRHSVTGADWVLIISPPGCRRRSGSRWTRRRRWPRSTGRTTPVPATRWPPASKQVSTVFGLAACVDEHGRSAQPTARATCRGTRMWQPL